MITLGRDLMDILYQGSKALSIVLFLYYGLSVLVSDAMVADFERFGLSRFRRLTGSLEVLGSVGLMLGYFLPILVVAAASGLTLLMVLGLATRYRARDSFTEALPALVLAVMNLYILVYALGRAS
ncbi:MAG: DoxX family protein [Deltaproteobacteria bacterium]|jgi:uncharacterized membrane protein YphA (DoxX/SURF4 family)